MLDDQLVQAARASRNGKLALELALTVSSPLIFRARRNDVRCAGEREESSLVLALEMAECKRG
jgi:hypothetical protein